MEFECDFDETNFCQYSSEGWGFHKSLQIAKKLFLESFSANPNDKKFNNQNSNHFPCTIRNNKGVSKLIKVIPKNLTQPLCLKISYLLEEKGQISIKDHKSKWSSNKTLNPNKWNYIRFPVNIQKSENVEMDSLLEISGQSICVDNFTVSNEQCSPTTNFSDNTFSHGNNFWITQPLSVLLAIITLMIILVFIGITLSFVCAKKSQKTLQRSKQTTRRSKTMRLDRFSLQNSINNDPTINSNFDIDTFGSSRQFSNQNRFLPAVVHVRSNPQLFCYSRHHSFLASKSVESNETNPNCRFSLALTEDAQVQLLTNSNLNSASPPVSSDLSSRNLPIIRQQSFTTTISHERTPSPTDQCPRIENNVTQQRPQSIVIISSFCAPIIDQSESDLSMESVQLQQLSQNNTRFDRSRPIRESMNIGYVSDNSPCDLPHYDAALELLAAHKMKLAQSINANDQSDLVNNNNTNELDEFDAID